MLCAPNLITIIRIAYTAPSTVHVWNDIDLIKTSINSRKTKQAIIWNAKRSGGKEIRNGTFVLNGLALVGRGTFPYGPAHEDDEFSDAGPLEVAEMAHVRSVCEDHRIGWSIRVAFQHQQRRDLHLVYLVWQKRKWVWPELVSIDLWLLSVMKMANAGLKTTERRWLGFYIMWRGYVFHR